MTVTGTTSHRLDLVKSYNPTQPYIVGVNGVTNITTDTISGSDVIHYTIDNISYKTILVKNLKLTNKEEGVKSININNPINSNKTYKPSPNKVNSGPGLDNVYPTTFSYVVQPTPNGVDLVDATEYFIFKDEAKMGVVFKPKVVEDVFIERQSTSVFEPQSRLSNIVSLDGLEQYNNGYYKILKL